MSHPTAPAGSTHKLVWTRNTINGAYDATAGSRNFVIMPHWTTNSRGRRVLAYYQVATNTEAPGQSNSWETIATVQADEPAALSAAKRWANARYNAILHRVNTLSAQVEVSKIAAQVNAEQDRIGRYVAQLEAMTQVQLMDELESCVRQNHYGSHDHQTRLVRAELGQRCSH